MKVLYTNPIADMIHEMGGRELCAEIAIILDETNKRCNVDKKISIDDAMSASTVEVIAGCSTGDVLHRGSDAFTGQSTFILAKALHEFCLWARARSALDASLGAKEPDRNNTFDWAIHDLAVAARE